LNRAIIALVTRIQRLGADCRREEGQQLIEYALILSVIVLICVGLLATVGTSVSTMLSKSTSWF
jgi:Flp pilus assembly pilin Flp